MKNVDLTQIQKEDKTYVQIKTKGTKHKIVSYYYYWAGAFRTLPWHYKYFFEVNNNETIKNTNYAENIYAIAILIDKTPILRQQ